MDNEPVNLTVKHLTEMRDEIGAMKAGIDRMEARMDGLATKEDLATAIGDVNGRIASLRRDVILYHSSVTGHGNLITDLENRMARIERCAEKSGWELGRLPQ